MTPADHAVQAHTDRHMQARSQEIEAAKRLQENRTPETVKAYEAAEAATKDAAFAEQAEYRRQGGEGLPPGLRPGAREALPGTPAPSPMAESVPSPPPGSPISPAAESVSPPAAAAERTESRQIQPRHHSGLRRRHAASGNCAGARGTEQHALNGAWRVGKHDQIRAVRQGRRVSNKRSGDYFTSASAAAASTATTAALISSMLAPVLSAATMIRSFTRVAYLPTFVSLSNSSMVMRPSTLPIFE